MINLINEYKNINERLNAVKFEYDLTKFALKQQKLNLKYSEAYQQYKTIKEKEERAEMAKSSIENELINLKKQIRELELESEILKLKLELNINSN